VEQEHSLAMRHAPMRALRSPQQRSAKEKSPPFPVRVVQDKAPGGDLLRVAIYRSPQQQHRQKEQTPAA
jgi:hypothetical protein